MKKFALALTALITMTVSANAMSYEQARQQALFLTDKMAYELNLTDDQYEAAYEINLDYLMSVNDPSDLYGIYWQHRNLDLSYILLDWQYQAFIDAVYFYRPLYWSGGYWHFGIYARYPHRDYFFFGRPHFYNIYRGGHSWHMNGGHSWYHGRNFGPRPGNERNGMRDGFNRGDYGRGNRNMDNRTNNSKASGNRSFGQGGINHRSSGNAPRTGSSQNKQMGNGNTTGTGSGIIHHGNGSNNRQTDKVRESSTRTTVTRPSSNSNGAFGGNRGSNIVNRSNSTPSRTFTPSSSSRSVSTPSRSTAPSSSRSSSFGSSSRGGSHSSGSSSSRGISHSSGGSRSGSFGGHR